MNALCDHTAGVQQLYEASYVSEYIVMNSRSLVEALVADCLIGRASGRICPLVSEFSVANLDVSLAFCRTSGRLEFAAARKDLAIFVV